MIVAVVPGIVAAVVAAWLTVVGWRHRRVPGGAAFAAMTAGIAIWALFDALGNTVPDLPTKILLSKVRYVGIVLAPLGWFVLAWEYTTHHASVSRRMLAALAAIPAITMVLAWTNEAHGLIWSSTSLVEQAGVTVMDRGHGAWFWVYIAYSYLLIAAASGLMLRLALHYRAEHLFGRQALALVAGVALPWIANVLFIAQLNPYPAIDPTPIGLGLGSLCFAYALFRHDLFQVVPVAHDAIVRALSDGIVVIDNQGRVVELNPAAERILGRTSAEMVGEPAAAALWADHQELVRHYTDLSETRVPVTLGSGGAVSHYDVKISPLRNRDAQVTGRVLTLHDVTHHFTPGQAPVAAGA